MVDPTLLCDKHLLGEHGEIHKHLPSFRKGYKISGRFNPFIQIQLNAILSRHDELAQEMIKRGMNHKSPLKDIPDLKNIYPDFYDLKVDVEYSINDLCKRCENCKSRIKNEKYTNHQFM